MTTNSDLPDPAARPDGECKTCHGTGKVRSVYGSAEHSKWRDCTDCGKLGAEIRAAQQKRAAMTSGEDRAKQGEALPKWRILPCPFCASEEISVERYGNARQSCIMVCENCGCRVESNENGYGEAWNRRESRAATRAGDANSDARRSIAQFLQDRFGSLTGHIPSHGMLDAADRILALMKPIPMILPCPKCGLLHVDAPEPEKGWTNPPHKSHLCHGCGTIWRPADVPTNGVAAIATSGKADTWPSDDKNREHA